MTHKKIWVHFLRSTEKKGNVMVRKEDKLTFPMFFSKYLDEFTLEEHYFKKLEIVLDIYNFIFHFYFYVIIRIFVTHLKRPVSDETYNTFRLFNKPTMGLILNAVQKLMYTAKEENKEIIEELNERRRWDKLTLTKDCMLDAFEGYHTIRRGHTFNLTYFFKLYVEFRNKKSHWLGILRSKTEKELKEWNEIFYAGGIELLKNLNIINGTYYLVRNVNLVKSVHEDEEDLCKISMIEFKEHKIFEKELEQYYADTSFIPNHFYYKYNSELIDLAPFITYFNKHTYFYVKKKPQSFIYCNFNGHEHDIEYKKTLRTYLFGTGYSDTQKLVDKAKLMVVTSKTNVRAILPNPNYAKFIPRLNYEKELTRYLNLKNKKYLLVLAGVGGVGKTALAQKIFLDLYKEKMTSQFYYDYLVWVSSKSLVLDPIEGTKKITPDFKNLEDILKLIFLVMDIHDIEGYKVEDFTLTLKEELENKSLLLVIDDFETISSNEKNKIWNYFDELFSDTNGKLIITTRYRKEVGEKLFTIKGLDAVSSKKLIKVELENYSGLSLSDDKIKAIAELTQGIPVAMKYVIGQYSLTRDLSKILDDLTKVKGKVNTFCFNNLISNLKESKIEILYLLSISENPLHIDIINELLEYNSNETLNEDIEELRRYSLLEDEEGCFLLTNLVRKFLKKYFDTFPSPKFDNLYIKFQAYETKLAGHKSPDQEEEDKVINIIASKVLDGKYQEAKQIFEINSKRFENSYHFHYKCIRYLQMFNNAHYIEKLYEQSFKLMQVNGINDLDLMYDLVNFYKFSKSKRDFSKALNYCKIGLKFSSKDPLLNYHAGDICLSLAKNSRELGKKLGKAKVNITKSAELLHKSRKFFDDAIDYFKSALKEQKRVEYIASIHFGLSRAFFYLGSYDLALENLIIAKKHDSKENYRLFEKTIRQRLKRSR